MRYRWTENPCHGRGRPGGLSHLLELVDLQSTTAAAELVVQLEDVDELRSAQDSLSTQLLDLRLGDAFAQTKEHRSLLP